MTDYQKRKEEINLNDKVYLTLEEASVLFGIGMHKLRELTNPDNCTFVLWNGSKRLIKRQLFQEYLDKQYSI